MFVYFFQSLVYRFSAFSVGPCERWFNMTMDVESLLVYISLQYPTTPISKVSTKHQNNLHCKVSDGVLMSIYIWKMENTWILVMTWNISTYDLSRMWHLAIKHEKIVGGAQL